MVFDGVKAWMMKLQETKTDQKRVIYNTNASSLDFKQVILHNIWFWLVLRTFTFLECKLTPTGSKNLEVRGIFLEKSLPPIRDLNQPIDPFVGSSHFPPQRMEAFLQLVEERRTTDKLPGAVVVVEHI